MRSGAPRLRDRLEREGARLSFGREPQLQLLSAQLAEGGAVVSFIHGIGGIGKTALLAALEPRLAEQGARVLCLDGRRIEPTPQGFLGALAGALSLSAVDVEAVAQALERYPKPTVWLVDEFDRLRLLDDWLRHVLLPALPERTRWMFAGRFAPQSAWLTTPGWSEAVLALRLEPLDEAASRALLAERGVPEERMPPLLALARGTPLALTLAAAAGVGELQAEASEGAVLAALAERSVQALSGPVREALEASSLVRRASRSVLCSMLGDRFDEQTFGQLRELSFVEHADDGLTLHETVRHALASRLRTLDPIRNRTLRQAALGAYDAELAQGIPRGPDAWRLLSDLLFLVEEPGIREAFFPSCASSVSMDRALPQDHPALFRLVQRHGPRAWMSAFEVWWSSARDAFRIARDERGSVAGFSLVAPASQLSPALAEADPLLAAWQSDLQASPERERGALFMRRAVGDGEGGALGEVRSAIWLDVKRLYVERPAQSALYLASYHGEGQLPLLQRLGFERIPIECDGEGTLRLEFGPAGIWSWLRRLVGASPSELDTARGWTLDPAARGLVVDGVAVTLSALEYDTLRYLCAHRERVVTRNELLEAVWQRRHVGSNVVDAVVRLLRKKLGPYASALETVRGHGYRLVG